MTTQTGPYANLVNTTAEEGIAKASDGYAPYVVQQVHEVHPERSRRKAWGVKLPLFRSVDLELNAARPYAGRPTDRYRYNGKEYIPQSGWYDYGARMYDPSIARWNAVDPLAELEFDQSGFNYVGNNSLLYTDPTGMKKRKNKHGSWWDDEDNEAVVYAERNNFNAAFGFDMMYQAHARNMAIHGEASPYRKHFQDGGAIAVGGVGGSLAIIGAASYAGIAGVNWWSGMSRIQQLRKLAMGRKVLRNINFGSGAGDLSTQLATNGGDWSKVNWTSVAGQTLVNGKYAFVANSASAFVTIKGENESIVDVNFGTSNFIEFGTNLWANGLSQLGGNLWSTAAAKQVYDGLANMATGSLSEGTKNSIFYGDVQGYTERQRKNSGK